MDKLGRRFFANVLLWACALALISFPARAQEQASPADAGRIASPVRSQAYPEIIYGHSLIPDFDRGYMIHHEIEAYSQNTQPMVSVYNASGKRVLEGLIWPKGAGSVRIRRTAMTREGGILAGGRAILQNGAISGYLAKTDAQGNTIQSVQTGDFKPEQICEAPDGTVWSLGKAGRPDGMPDADTEVVRHYSFEKGLLHSFLPERTVQAVVNSSHPWFVPFDSYLRCGKEKVVVYLNFTDEYVEIDTSSFELKRWKLDEAVVEQGKASGLAITDDGKVYLSFSAHGMSGPVGLTGLYQVKTEPGNPVARLLPVVGTVNEIEKGKRLAAGTFIWLWGADGNQLVVFREEERDASWVSVVNTPATD